MTRLLENGADVDLKCGEHGTALYAACLNGNTEVARILLKHGAIVDFVQERKGTALDGAFRANQLQTIQMLLDSNANLDVTKTLDRSYLQVACRRSVLSEKIHTAV